MVASIDEVQYKDALVRMAFPIGLTNVPLLRSRADTIKQPNWPAVTTSSSCGMAEPGRCLYIGRLFTGMSSN